jgi:hypothetical protein
VDIAVPSYSPTFVELAEESENGACSTLGVSRRWDRHDLTWMRSWLGVVAPLPPVQTGLDTDVVCGEDW